MGQGRSVEQPVKYSSTIYSAQSVNVTTNTVMINTQRCTASHEIAVWLVNGGSATVSAFVEVSGDAGTTWYRTPYGGLTNLSAGQARLDLFSVRGMQYWRLVGTANSGTQAVTVSAWHVAQP